MIRHEKPKETNVYEHEHLRTSIQSLFHSSLLLIYLQVESHNTCRKYKHSVLRELLCKGKPLPSSSKIGSGCNSKLSVMNTLGGKKKKKAAGALPHQHRGQITLNIALSVPHHPNATLVFLGPWQTKALDPPKLRDKTVNS